MKKLPLLIILGALGCLVMADSDPAESIYARPEAAPAFSQPKFISQPSPRAYPGALYETRAAVTGGIWPYRFALKTAPAGMRLNQANGAIAWQAPGQPEVAKVTLLVRDQAGRQAEQSFQIEVTAKGFYFVSPAGDDANPGTFDQPWKTLMRAVEDVPESDMSTLYLRGGDYQVVVPSRDGGIKGANNLRIRKTSPRRWVAWPGEKPVIDLGWTEVMWREALKREQEQHGNRGTTQRYGHRITIDRGIDDMLFDGLEVKNASYFMFLMHDGDRSRYTWRRCDLHHLYGDYFENPAFIFGSTPDRVYEKPPPGVTYLYPFGKRPRSTPYRNFIIQECTFADRPYSNPRGEHGGGIVTYFWEGTLVEDCTFERIELGWAICDKDNGWDNTYRNNILRGNVVFASQGCSDGINFHHNYVDGDLQIGAQPGWVRNIWIHHNALNGAVIPMIGNLAVPEPLASLEGVGGPTDASSHEVIKNHPQDRRLIQVWNNVIGIPDRTMEGEKAFLCRAPNDSKFAGRFRFVQWDHNLVDERAEMTIGWTRVRFNWSELKAGGFDVNGTRGIVSLDEAGRLASDSPWRNTYGRDAGLGTTATQK